jgi:hypothetical protein
MKKRAFAAARATRKPTRRERGVPWVLCRFNTVPPSAECTRCGERLVYVLPVNLDVFLAMSKAFVKVHGRCSEGKKT